MNEKKNIQETLRRQLLSKIITEAQYKEKVAENLAEEAKLEAPKEILAEDYQLRQLLLSNIISEQQYEEKLINRLIKENSEEFKRTPVFYAYDFDGTYLGDIEGDFSEHVYDIEDLRQTPEFQAFETKVAPNEVDRVTREVIYTYQGRQLRDVSYGSTGSTALYDDQADKWFNQSGQSLQSPEDRIANYGDVDW